MTDLRAEYERRGLRPADLRGDPTAFFGAWYADAVEAGVPDPNAMVLATADSTGAPSARAVLMKDHGPDGLVFYSSRSSRKGRELAVNPRASVVFVWQPLHRQVRVEGLIARVSDREADEYFASRPPESRAGAAASPQSSVIPDRDWLLARVGAVDATSRPASWGGYVLRPQVWEFWQGQRHRLHDRVRARETDGGWTIERLAP